MPERADLPAYAQLLEMSAWAHHRCYLLEAAVKLELADHIGTERLTAEQLAILTDTRPHLLYRFLRALCSLGILTEDNKAFSLTKLGEALQEGAPGAAKSAIYMLARPETHRAWEQLPQALKTGEPAFEIANHGSFFDFIGSDPECTGRFSETMISLSNAEPPAVAAAYDFSAAQRIVDIGAATGYLLAAIMERFPAVQATLFDLPHVVADAPALLSERGIAERVRVVSGSFFESVPDDGDIYILSHIIHDWPEEQALEILRICHSNMPERSTLLLVEHVLADTNSPNMGTLMDMTMLVNLGGEERTAEEYRALLKKAGFSMQEIIPTASPSSIIVAAPD